MSRTIELHAADGVTISAYRADPAGKPKGGIVVLQEIFGVNHHIRAVADGYAAEGYLAVAPALFDRGEPGVELGYDQAGITRGVELRAKPSLDQTLADIAAAVAVAAEGGKVGVVGYCWGGLLTYLASSRLTGIAAAVGYYGGGISNFLSDTPKTPLLLHFGERDAHIPQTDVDKIRQAHPAVPIQVYPADHGFNCDERGSYDKPSAELARQRTLEFFAAYLA
jgi:carboxymethylenebutenolidase